MIQKKITLSIIIPCLNEAETLGIVIDKAIATAKNMRLGYEVVVADNGSTDNSRNIALSKGARVLSVKQKGYGSALMVGFTQALGKYLLFADADGSYDFGQMARFIEKLDKGYDVVVGSRFLGTIHKGAMSPLHRYIGTPVLTWLTNLFFGTQYSDCNSGMRALTKSAFSEMELKQINMEFASEMLVAAKQHHLTVAEIPIDYRPDLRRHNLSHLRTWYHGRKHLEYLLSMAFRSRYFFQKIWLLSILLFSVYFSLFFLRIAIISVPSEGDSLMYHIPKALSVLNGTIFSSLKFTYENATYPGSTELLLAVLMIFRIPLNLFNVVSWMILAMSLYMYGRCMLSRLTRIVWVLSVVLLPSMIRLLFTQTADIWLAVFFLWSLITIPLLKKHILFSLFLGFSLGMLIGSKFSGPLFAIAIGFVYGLSLIHI